VWYEPFRDFASWLFILDVLIILGAIPWILSLKRDTVAALAWSLIVILLPIFGFLLFLIFGYTHVYRPLKRKRRHRVRFEARASAAKRGRVLRLRRPGTVSRPTGRLAAAAWQ